MIRPIYQCTNNITYQGFQLKPGFWIFKDSLGRLYFSTGKVIVDEIIVYTMEASTYVCKRISIYSIYTYHENFISKKSKFTQFLKAVNLYNK